jgi:hypothetical protein
MVYIIFHQVTCAYAVFTTDGGHVEHDHHYQNLLCNKGQGLYTLMYIYSYQTCKDVLIHITRMLLKNLSYLKVFQFYTHILHFQSPYKNT